MSRRQLARLAIVVGAALLLMPGVATANSESWGGPWTYKAYYITCKFEGGHYTEVEGAYVETIDWNGGCANLGVRLKWQYGGQYFDSGAVYDSLEHTSFTWWAGWGTVAASSKHRAQDRIEYGWSQWEQPHAW